MTALAATGELAREHTPLPHGIPFLTAAWRNLVMLNFEIEPHVVEPYVPRGVELDLFAGRAIVSIVAFEFENAKFYGIPAPLCRRIPEVNLRIYVQRSVRDRRRPGVVFVKEIAPRRAISMATVANRCYHEHYQMMPMRYAITPAKVGSGKRYHYAWKYKGLWNEVDVTASGAPFRPHSDSEEAFVIDHWFAYTRQPDGSCVERQVAHAPWSIRHVDSEHAHFVCDAAKIYGPAFASALNRPPTSTFVSSGSAVGVFRGSRVR